MFHKRHYYLVELQYLGFRYHGWQQQPEVLTVERMVRRTISYVLGHKKFKVLAAGRTDSKVSVNQTYIELFLDADPLNLKTFLMEFNTNLPPDIRALSIIVTDENFNIIDAPEIKEYIYLFSHGTKMHPFGAPFLVNVTEPLNIPLMQHGAKLFQGTHDFWSFAYKPSPETKTEVTVQGARIEINTMLTANFFPEETFLFRVSGKGFKRHQVRLMMGALFDLGTGAITLDQFKKALDGSNRIKLERIAPASGLLLHSVKLKR